METSDKLKQYFKELIKEYPSIMNERDYCVEMLDKCLSDGKDEEYCATLFEDVLNCVRENKPLTNLPHLIDYVGNKEIVIEALKQHIDLDYIRGNLSQKYEDAEKVLDKYLDKA